ncbi:VOC family protein [Rhizobium sp. FY34]|uniref:VOC family protein n=1 Tax=Rhizobium sp. FY34 TaxID=2562309 RepID=UPI001484FD20|nr:VOC family protein [Rhizobium sp. FY34]
MPLQKLAFAELRVPDLGSCLDFHTQVLGLNIIAQSAGRAYLGAGGDDGLDLILTEDPAGRSGAPRFALMVDGADDLIGYQSRLQEAGLDSWRESAPAPGIAESLSFTLPSGHVVALVTAAASSKYLHPARRSAGISWGIGPVDVDHITLRVGDSLALNMKCLSEVLGFRASDVSVMPDGNVAAVWMRVGDYHHDVAMFGGPPGESLDHLAWNVSTFENIKRSLDVLGQFGIPAEAGPGRHGIGGNLYAYFRAPGGNRYELSAEMPRFLNRDAEPVIWTDPAAGFSAWGSRHPESFKDGS